MQQLERPADTNDYLDAFYKLKGAKNWLLAVLLIALVGDLAAALTVRLTSLLDSSAAYQADLAAVGGTLPAGDAVAEPPAEPAEPAEPTTEPAAPSNERPPFELTPPATQSAPARDEEPPPFEAALRPSRADEPPEADQAESTPLVDREQVYKVLVIALPVARAVALLAAVLLVSVLMVSLKITLLGRLSGVAYLTSAMLWSLLLAVILVPWNLAFPGLGLPSALFSGAELVQGIARARSTTNVGWAADALYWLRFVAYPGVGLLLWLAVLIQYRRGFRPVVTSASE